MDATLEVYFEDLADLDAMDNSVEKIMAADAIEKGRLVLFNALDNQVQEPGYMLTQQPHKYNLGTLTIMAYDHVHGRWFLYREKQLSDIWSRDLADHFADNEYRRFHKLS